MTDLLIRAELDHRANRLRDGIAWSQDPWWLRWRSCRSPQRTHATSTAHRSLTPTASTG